MPLEWIIPTGGLILGLSALLLRDYVVDRRRRGLPWWPLSTRRTVLYLALLLTPLLTGLILPVLARARVNTGRTSSASNLNQLGKALWMYADEPGNNNMYPASLWDLYPNYISDHKTFFRPGQCPSANPPPVGRPIAAKYLDATSYVYVPGHGVNSNPTTIVAYEKVPTNGARNVLVIGGSVEFVPDADFLLQLQQQAARKNPEDDGSR